MRMRNEEGQVGMEYNGSIGLLFLVLEFGLLDGRCPTCRYLDLLLLFRAPSSIEE